MPSSIPKTNKRSNIVCNKMANVFELQEKKLRQHTTKKDKICEVLSAKRVRYFNY